VGEWEREGELEGGRVGGRESWKKGVSERGRKEGGVLGGRVEEEREE
jgi:hypothetical protein